MLIYIFVMFLCLFLGLISENATMCCAAGLFAIAGEILVHGKKKEG